ncbi:hypothetical protein, conserved [Eimeria maxima]|uniref:Uncharacterized protein n=1 Tax=Eimeria maxima TaxID=5804 RepID=U6MDE7_EIMMA|nr:hypothetical protein, conserved [Eimeria maxima]CDJ61063.1 hypothetical protein, conserved [Eimeria maxima]
MAAMFVFVCGEVENDAIRRCWLLVECLLANCVLDGFVYDDGKWKWIIRLCLGFPLRKKQFDCRCRGQCAGEGAGCWWNVCWQTVCWMELCMTMGNGIVESLVPGTLPFFRAIARLRSVVGVVAFVRCWLLVECLLANCVLDGVVYDDGECKQETVGYRYRQHLMEMRHCACICGAFWCGMFCECAPRVDVTFKGTKSSEALGGDWRYVGLGVGWCGVAKASMDVLADVTSLWRADVRLCVAEAECVWIVAIADGMGDGIEYLIRFHFSEAEASSAAWRAWVRLFADSRCWLLAECLLANCALDGVVYDDGECFCRANASSSVGVDDCSWRGAMTCCLLVECLLTNCVLDGVVYDDGEY